MPKLTINVEEDVYKGLHEIIGPRNIGRFLTDLARPHVVRKNLAAAYAEMASDEKCEQEALNLIEGVMDDQHETRS